MACAAMRVHSALRGGPPVHATVRLGLGELGCWLADGASGDITAATGNEAAAAAISLSAADFRRLVYREADPRFLMLQRRIRVGGDSELLIYYLVGLNIAWFLHDVSDANGGTRLAPGSHRSGWTVSSRPAGQRAPH